MSSPKFESEKVKTYSVHNELLVKVIESSQDLMEDVLNVFISQDNTAVPNDTREFVGHVLNRDKDSLMSVKDIIETNDVWVLDLLQELDFS